MQSALDRQTSSESSRTEAERQLVASAERHREVVASMQELGRPEAGQHVSVKSVARAVHLVSFALRRAAEAGEQLLSNGRLRTTFLYVILQEERCVPSP
jgi:hypothetical protein